MAPMQIELQKWFAEMKPDDVAEMAARKKMAPMQKAVQLLVQKICKWKNLKSQRY